MQDDGLPTADEIASYGPPIYSWEETKDVAADLGLLKRQTGLQQRYDTWRSTVMAQYGTMEAYLVQRRLAWTPSAMSPNDPPFSIHTPPTHYRIARNDWPYSIPADVSHFVVWTAVPLIAATDLTPELEKDGMWGFTGGPPGETRIENGGIAALQITEFVKREWPEKGWETAWFMNPPRLQSIRGMVHFHIFARKKDA